METRNKGLGAAPSYEEALERISEIQAEHSYSDVVYTITQAVRGHFVYEYEVRPMARGSDFS